MTKLNVFAAVHNTGEFHTGRVCSDCEMYLANGEVENPDSTWNERKVYENLEKFDVTLGHYHDENQWDTRCYHAGSGCEGDCDCERTEFSWSECWLCGSTLGGYRADIVAIKRELLDTYMNQEQFDKLSDLCSRYGVPMAISDYLCYGPNASMMIGWCEGWLGGIKHNGTFEGMKKTIMVGVSPEGDSHS